MKMEAPLIDNLNAIPANRNEIKRDHFAIKIRPESLWRACQEWVGEWQAEVPWKQNRIAKEWKHDRAIKKNLQEIRGKLSQAFIIIAMESDIKADIKSDCEKLEIKIVRKKWNDTLTVLIYFTRFSRKSHSWKHSPFKSPPTCAFKWYTRAFLKRKFHKEKSCLRNNIIFLLSNSTWMKLCNYCSFHKILVLSKSNFLRNSDKICFDQYMLGDCNVMLS